MDVASDQEPETTARPVPSREIGSLLAIMKALRDLETGCPWDIRQTFATIAPYAIEEAYEVADSIARGDMADLRDELGDLLLQIVFHARMADEAGLFDFGGIVEAITTKLIRRHPHVFGETRARTPDEVKALWDAIKRAEKAERVGPDAVATSVLDGVPLALPALTRSEKLTRRAAAVGFSWPDHDGVFAKIDEELAELRESVSSGDHRGAEEEIGDLLFTVVNLARHLDLDPEAALRATNAKFDARFRFVENALAADGRSPAESTLAEMDRFWDEAKRRERSG